MDLAIRNWLIMALEEPSERINESYYFDKRDNQFFSIFITDYFLSEDDPNVSINSPYSSFELKQVINRIDRIEINDRSIICLPRLSISERKQMLMVFFQFHVFESINEKEIQDIVSNENGRGDFKLTFLQDANVISAWKNFKEERLEKMARVFCKANDINISSVSLFTEDKATSMHIDLKTK